MSTGRLKEPDYENRNCHSRTRFPCYWPSICPIGENICARAPRQKNSWRFRPVTRPHEKKLAHAKCAWSSAGPYEEILTLRETEISRVNLGAHGKATGRAAMKKEKHSSGSPKLCRSPSWFCRCPSGRLMVLRCLSDSRAASDCRPLRSAFPPMGPVAPQKICSQK